MDIDRFNIGDRVVIVSGLFEGEKGTIQDIINHVTFRVRRDRGGSTFIVLESMIEEDYEPTKSGV
jgi:hypothetical protein